MSGTKLRLNVFDRKGELYDEVHLPANKETPNMTACIQIVWDKRSEKLAGRGSPLYTHAPRPPHTKAFCCFLSSRCIYFCLIAICRNECNTTVGRGRPWSPVLVRGPKAVTAENVLIYKVRQREATKLETQNMKELTHLAWDPPGHMLSVGTAKVGGGRTNCIQ